LGALSTGDLIDGGRPTPFAVLSDLVLPEDRRAAAGLGELMGAVPADTPLTVLCPRSDSRLGRLLQRQGFQPAGTEVAMLRPFTSEIAQNLGQTSGGWYVAVESVIGV
jgi:hypothetical protein